MLARIVLTMSYWACSLVSSITESFMSRFWRSIRTPSSPRRLTMLLTSARGTPCSRMGLGLNREAAINGRAAFLTRPPSNGRTGGFHPNLEGLHVRAASCASGGWGTSSVPCDLIVPRIQYLAGTFAIYTVADGPDRSRTWRSPNACREAQGSGGGSGRLDQTLHERSVGQFRPARGDRCLRYPSCGIVSIRSGLRGHRARRG